MALAALIFASVGDATCAAAGPAATAAATHRAASTVFNMGFLRFVVARPMQVHR